MVKLKLLIVWAKAIYQRSKAEDELEQQLQADKTRMNYHSNIFQARQRLIHSIKRVHKVRDAWRYGVFDRDHLNK